MSISIEEIGHAIYPIQITLQLFGLNPYEFSKKTSWRYFMLRLCITLFHILLYWFIMIISVQISSGKAEEVQEFYYNSEVIKVTVQIYIYVLIFFMVLMFTYNFLNNKKRLIFLYNLLDIIKEMELVDFKLTNEIRKVIRYIFWHSLILILVVVFGIYLIADYIYIIYFFKPIYGFIIILIEWTVILPNSVYANILVTIAIWLVFIEKLYEVNNKALLLIIQNRNRNDSSFVKYLRKFIKIHINLSICLHNFNKWYSTHLFLVIIYNYTCLLCNVYFLVHNRLFEVGSIYQRSLFINFIKDVTQNIVCLCFVTCYAVNMKYQVSTLR